jgi:hypothetical protein
MPDSILERLNRDDGFCVRFNHASGKFNLFVSPEVEDIATLNFRELRQLGSELIAMADKAEADICKMHRNNSLPVIADRSAKEVLDYDKNSPCS